MSDIPAGGDQFYRTKEDGHREKQPDTDVISDREFDYCGVRVKEIILQLPDGKFKLAWIRAPLEETIIDGRKSPFVHHDTTSKEGLLISRRMVSYGFCDHYGLKPSPEDLLASDTWPRRNIDGN